MADLIDIALASLPTRVVLSDERDLSLTELVAVARGGRQGRARVALSGAWEENCRRSSAYVDELLSTVQGRDDAALASLVRSKLASAECGGNSPSDDDAVLARAALVYGVTTGFGNNKDKPLRTREDARRMQLNLLRSHAVGVGPPAPGDVVRATVLLRLRSFIQGYSGVRPELVAWLVELLNRDIDPWVPQQGSVGSSGDLCPMAHLFLSVIGEGLGWPGGAPQGALQDGLRSQTGTASARDDRQRAADSMDDRGPPRPMRELLSEAGLEPLPYLEAKEGLALTNGTAFTTAYLALAVYDAAVLLGTANVAASMSLQALLGCTRAFDPKVHRVRRHEGQRKAARMILELACGSDFLDTSGDVQDAYSLRCAPQVHGAAWTAIEHVLEIVEREINGVTDNPLLFAALQRFPAEERDPFDGYHQCIWNAYSAGNFHGEPVGMAADYLKIAVAELGSISERRTQHLLDAHHSRGLPSNLAARPETGLHSGLMIAQYSAASLVSENKVLAHPASVDSIPTSANIEDHVAMSTIAARHARQVVCNTREIVAIELLAACRALTWRLAEAKKREPSVGPRPSACARRIMTLLGASGAGAESLTPEEDDVLWPKVADVRRCVADGDVLRAAYET